MLHHYFNKHTPGVAHKWGWMDNDLLRTHSGFEYPAFKTQTYMDIHHTGLFITSKYYTMNDSVAIKTAKRLHD